MAAHEGRDGPDVRDTDIVVGLDGSPSAKAALRWALAQARLAHARVHAVTAWEYPAYYGWVARPRMRSPPPSPGRCWPSRCRRRWGSTSRTSRCWRASSPVIRPRSCSTCRARPGCWSWAAGGTVGSRVRCSGRSASAACSVRSARSWWSAAGADGRSPGSPPTQLHPGDRHPPAAPAAGGAPGVPMPVFGAACRRHTR